MAPEAFLFAGVPNASMPGDCAPFSSDVHVDTNALNHGGDASLLRRLNESAVLELIRTQGPITRSDVARQLRLSLPTITRVVASLMESGLVRAHSSATSRGGRRPTLLEFNYRANLVIGLYIGQTMVGSLADLNGQILERRTVPSAYGEAGVASIVVLIETLMQEAERFGLPVRGVGVGAPSVVHFPEGIVTWAPSLGWRDLPLKARLEEALHLPIFVENEVNLLALGEQWRGAGQGVDNLICVSLGAGLGAGLVLHGQLHRGPHQAAGEIGYMVPNERYLGRVYAAYGCLEDLAGSNGIVRRAEARLRAGAPSVLAASADGGSGTTTVEAVLAAARAGDALAQAVLAETVDYLSLAVINMASLLDPERIILSGELSEYGDLFLEPIRARVQGILPAVPEIVVSELRRDAAVLGAVAVVLRETSGMVFVQPTRA